MKIIIAHCGNSYCGCDVEDVFFYDDDVVNKYIEEDVREYAYNNAESFAHVHFGWDEEYTDEDYEDYIENYMTYNWHEADYFEYVEWCENWGYEIKSKEELGLE